VVATGPLTSDEAWTVIKPGTLLALREGRIAHSIDKEPPAEKARPKEL
jgi:predicted glutamine amidotransferase